MHSNQKGEGAHPSIVRWMDEQSVVYLYNRILLSLKKEEYSDPCYLMGEPWRPYAKWNKPDTKGQMCDSTLSSEIPRDKVARG